MLTDEAETWWRFIKPSIPVKDGVIPWEVFKIHFHDNYFPMDLRKRKAREFLESKQGEMSVGEYTTKFSELGQYWPHYGEVGTGGEMCSPYGHDLREDQMASRSGGPQKNRRGFGGIPKPYAGPLLSGGGLRVPPVNRGCFKCDGPHMIKDCPQLSVPSMSQISSTRSTQQLQVRLPATKDVQCFHCGRKGHYQKDCWFLLKSNFAVSGKTTGSSVEKPQAKKDVECFHCGKKGHLKRDCWYLLGNNSNASVRTVKRSTAQPKPQARVIAMTDTPAEKSEDLIRGKCYQNETS